MYFSLFQGYQGAENRDGEKEEERDVFRYQPVETIQRTEFPDMLMEDVTAVEPAEQLQGKRKPFGKIRIDKADDHRQRCPKQELPVCLFIPDQKADEVGNDGCQSQDKQRMAITPHQHDDWEKEQRAAPGVIIQIEEIEQDGKEEEGEKFRPKDKPGFEDQKP